MTADNHGELMGLSKDIGKVDSRVSSIEAGLTAMQNKQKEDMDFVHNRFHEVLNEQSKGFGRIDKQHLELMLAITVFTEKSAENDRRLDDMQPTFEFVEKWRQRWVAVIITTLGIGAVITWVLAKTQYFKSIIK